MKVKQLNWRHNSAPFANGEFGYINHMQLFSVDWNSARSRDQDEDQNWLMTSRLPFKFKAFKDKDEAKAQAQRSLEYFISKLMEE